MRRLAPLVCTACVLMIPAALEAQTRWLAGAFYDRDFFAGSSSVWSDWQTLRSLFLRQFESGAVGLEVAREERFGLVDEAFALDTYLNLWSGSYGNLRVRTTPEADIVPRSDWRLEIFQSLSGGWEVSGSVWHMNVPGPNVVVGGVGVGRYVSAWYVRAIANVAEIDGTRSGGGYVSARRFFEDDGRQFVEWTGGIGGEAVTVGPGPLFDVRDTWFLQGSLQRFFWEPFGLSLSAGLHDFENIPVRRRISAGILARF